MLLFNAEIQKVYSLTFKQKRKIQFVSIKSKLSYECVLAHELTHVSTLNHQPFYLWFFWKWNIRDECKLFPLILRFIKSHLFGVFKLQQPQNTHGGVCFSWLFDAFALYSWIKLLSGRCERETRVRTTQSASVGNEPIERTRLPTFRR